MCMRILNQLCAHISRWCRTPGSCFVFFAWFLSHIKALCVSMNYFILFVLLCLSMVIDTGIFIILDILKMISFWTFVLFLGLDYKSMFLDLRSICHWLSSTLADRIKQIWMMIQKLAYHEWLLNLSSNALRVILKVSLQRHFEQGFLTLLVLFL